MQRYAFSHFSRHAILAIALRRRRARSIRPSTEKPDSFGEAPARSSLRERMVAVITNVVAPETLGRNISTRTIAPTGGQLGETMNAPFPLTSRVEPSPRDVPMPGVSQLNSAKTLKEKRTCRRRSNTCLSVSTRMAFSPLLFSNFCCMEAGRSVTADSFNCHRVDLHGHSLSQNLNR
jgi:hypothetical protein